MTHTAPAALIFSCAAVALLAGCGRTDPAAVRKDVEVGLSENAALVALKQYDPTAYKAVADTLSAELANGVPKAAIIDHLFGRVVTAALGRLPTASDSSVIGFSRVVVKEMAELNRQDPKACVRWLFPTPGDSVDLQTYLSQELRNDSYQALAEVIRTSAESPQPIPTSAGVADDQQVVSAQLRQRYGENLALLQRVHAPSTDAATVCAIVIDLYNYMLQLPPERAARLLRYRFSSSQRSAE